MEAASRFDLVGPTAYCDREQDAPSAVPADLLVLILDARPYRTSPVDWNHGYTYGVAVSLETQEVMYWMEDW